MLIFLDESGDLGCDWSKPKTSAYFVITLLVCDSLSVYADFKKAVNKTIKNKLNYRKKTIHRSKELKGNETTLEVKRYFFKHLPLDGWQLYNVIFDKKNNALGADLKKNKHKVYNRLAHYLLEQVIFPERLDFVNLVIDKCKNKTEISEFNQLITTHLELRLPIKALLSISHNNSAQNPGLQAVDLFCWGIARKHHRGQSEWYAIFQDKIAFSELITLE